MNSEENFDEYGQNNTEITQNVNSKRNYHPRRVSFPERDTELVTGYLEPVDPLRLAINVDKAELLKAYELSCQRHNTDPIQAVVDQIKNFNNCDDRIDTFNLSKVALSCYGCESLEEVFKRVQFIYIDLTECELTRETASILFEMFEYYESAIHLNISSNSDLGVRGWQACARYLKTSNTLEELEMRDIRLTDQEADCLLRPLAFNKHLQILKLENCNLHGNAMRHLVNALSSNKTLRELYLADNKLGISEAVLLGNLLKLNRTLQVLDLSNNQIQDDGLYHIVYGLCNQVLVGCLEMLVLWNNFLTNLCSSNIDNLLKNYRNLAILNIGCNNLHDSFVVDIKETLKQNQSILRLGLQSTSLTCTSAINLADTLKTNKTLERIDLRENCILITGVRALSDCLDINKHVIQIDLNETTSGKNAEEYHSLVQEINAKCARNREKIAIELETNRLTISKGTSRKISLTCQTLTPQQFEFPPLLSEPKKVVGKLRSPAPSPAPSPIPSPVSSPIPPPVTKSRFSVSRVTESKMQSRFTVLTVSDPSEPPRPVTTPITTSSGPATVGFKCSSPDSRRMVISPPSPTPMNGQKAESPASEKIPTGEPKPMSSIEKLLSIFQAPTNLFSRTNTSSPPLTRQCDNIKHLPLSNVNKNVSISAASVYAEPDSTAESIKENISPEHSLTVSSVKRATKNEYNITSALDIKDKDVLKHASLALCSSSEDSDSGLMTLDSCPASVTDSGSVISDDSAASFENTASTPSVQSPASESEHSENDVTNNNKWGSGVSVTVTPIDTDDN